MIHSIHHQEAVNPIPPLLNCQATSIGRFESIKQRLLFGARVRWSRLLSYLRVSIYKLQGMKIGAGCNLGRISLNWPSQIAIGNGSNLLDGVTFDYCHGVPRPGPNIWIGDRCFIGRGVEFNVRRQIKVGNDCLIAAGCRFIDHDHGISAETLIREQDDNASPIAIADNVWLGVNVVVLKGVSIGTGAVVGAGAVVTKSIPSGQIWGGVPAKPLTHETEHC